MKDRHLLVDGVPGHKGDGLFLHPLMMELGGESVSKGLELHFLWNGQRLQVAAEPGNSLVDDLSTSYWTTRASTIWKGTGASTLQPQRSAGLSPLPALATPRGGAQDRAATCPVAPGPAGTVLDADGQRELERLKGQARWSGRSWGEVLVTGMLAATRRSFKTYLQARAWARKQRPRLTSKTEWCALVKAQRVPKPSPPTPGATTASSSRDGACS